MLSDASSQLGEYFCRFMLNFLLTTLAHLGADNELFRLKIGKFLAHFLRSINCGIASENYSRLTNGKAELTASARFRFLPVFSCKRFAIFTGSKSG